MVPWDLNAQEQKKRHENPLLTFDDTRRESLTLWQEEWSALEEEARGKTVQEIIPDFHKWHNRLGAVNVLPHPGNHQPWKLWLPASHEEGRQHGVHAPTADY